MKLQTFVCHCFIWVQFLVSSCSRVVASSGTQFLVSLCSRVVASSGTQFLVSLCGRVVTSSGTQFLVSSCSRVVASSGTQVCSNLRMLKYTSKDKKKHHIHARKKQICEEIIFSSSSIHTFKQEYLYY